MGDILGDLLRALERSGMRAVDCDGCGRDFLTRDEGYHCPPCRGDARPDLRTELAIGVHRSILVRLLWARCDQLTPEGSFHGEHFD